MQLQIKRGPKSRCQLRSMAAGHALSTGRETAGLRSLLPAMVVIVARVRIVVVVVVVIVVVVVLLVLVLVSIVLLVGGRVVVVVAILFVVVVVVVVVVVIVVFVKYKQYYVYFKIQCYNKCHLMIFKKIPYNDNKKNKMLKPIMIPTKKI